MYATYLEERLCALPHLFALVLVDILLAHVRAPLSNNLFVENIVLVQRHKDLGRRSRREQRVARVGVRKETFDTAEQRLLVLFRRAELRVSAANSGSTHHFQQRDPCGNLRRHLVAKQVMTNLHEHLVLAHDSILLDLSNHIGI